MNNDNQWLLMTYYCPTHGSGERCEPLQISQYELKKVKTDYHDNLTKNSWISQEIFSYITNYKKQR